MRRAGSLVFFAALVLAASARAQQPVDKEACATAYEKAQVERKAHKLVAAHASLTYCAQKGCPAIARHDCTTWLAEVDAALPTVVFEIRQDGKLVRDVRVSIDGSVVLERVEDGATLPIDPGAHSLRFDRPGSRSVTQEVIIVQGAKSRLLSVTLEAETTTPSTAPPPTSSSAPSKGEPPERERTPSTRPEPGPPILAWIFGAVAIGGVASFAGFGLRGVSEEDKLRRECAPTCGQENIDFVDRMYLIADISLGIGLVAAGISAYFFIARPGATR
jgi:hypothetical protein